MAWGFVFPECLRYNERMVVTSRIKDTLENNSQRTLWLLIIIYTAAVFTLLAFKYATGGYNAIDLGIYNQVFFNSSHGRLFQFSIHPHLYLGDHFELLILLLVPLYSLFRSPLSLLFLQTLGLALAAWPLYLIARQKLSGLSSLLLSLAFLASPFVLNMNFFEFHMLPFAIPLLFFAFYFYLKNNFGAWLVFLILSLLVREDVAFVILMFGPLALLDKKRIRWIVTPVALAILWFLLAIVLTGHFNPSGSYKFFSLYAWLGETPREIVTNLFTKPWLVARQIFSFNNAFLLAGLLVPLAGLPLLSVKYLTPALPIILQLLLTSVSSTIVLQTHYPALIIPFLFIASVFALANLPRGGQSASALKTFILRQKMVFFVIIAAAVLYSSLTFSPLVPALKSLANYGRQRDAAKINDQLTSLVGRQEAVAASFNFLPPLSNRTQLYSLHYAFLGKRQFSNEPYELPATTDTLLVNFDDFIIYYLQSQNIEVYQEQYANGAERINQFIKQHRFGIKKIIDDVAVYEKNYSSPIELVETIPTSPDDTQQANINLDDLLTFVTWEKLPYQTDGSYQIIPLGLYWRAQQKLTDDYQLEVNLKNKIGQIVYQKLYPLGYGLYPTSTWAPSETVKTNYWFLIPGKYKLASHSLSLQVVAIKGYMGLDGVRSAKMEITKKTNIGPALRIDYNTR